MLGCMVKAPSTLALRTRWRHVRSGRVSICLRRNLLALGTRLRRAADLDSTGWSARPRRSGQGGRTPPRLYRHKRGYPRCWPSPDRRVDARLREGRATTAQGRRFPAPRRWDGVRYAGPEVNSRCGPTALLCPRHRRTSRLPARWMAVSTTIRQNPPVSSRPYPRRIGGRPKPTGWTASGRDHLHSL